MKRRVRSWSVTEWLLLGAIMLAIVWLCGCIPVRVVPSDQPILVAPVGVSIPQEDGTTALNPKLPQPRAGLYPPPQGVPWGSILAVGLALCGGGGTAVAFAAPVIRRIRVAAQIACQLADDCAKADTDAEVDAAKKRAGAAQDAAGVRTVTNRIRGKA
ncbi:MAG: hypothetical protein H0W48_00480 [Methylibium sp.]|nr:hypothetical protein [Methylibium sp.]